jgi:hypothetical protein
LKDTIVFRGSKDYRIASAIKYDKFEFSITAEGIINQKKQQIYSRYIVSYAPSVCWVSQIQSLGRLGKIKFKEIFVFRF